MSISLKRAKVQADGIPRIALGARVGKEAIYSTHNLCDKTTWYSESARATEEALTDSGDGLTWNSVNAFWVDMTHGKIFDEEGLIEDQQLFNPGSPHGYVVLVEVSTDGGTSWDPKTEHTAFGGTDNDYGVDYATGNVTFVSTQAGNLVRASYSHAGSSAWILRPLVGKVITIEKSEIQFSGNVSYDASIIMEAQGYVESFAPEYWDQQAVVGATLFQQVSATPPDEAGNAGDMVWNSTTKVLYQHDGTEWQAMTVGPYPGGTRVPIEKTVYKTLDQIIDESVGTFPEFPVLGGAERGTLTVRHILQFHYAAAKLLYDSVGMLIRITTSGDMVFGGDRATATFYLTANGDPGPPDVFQQLGIT